MPIVKEAGSEEFERLLFWLDTNQETAAVRYERIRSKLIKFFVCRGCFDADSLADETIDRVTVKIKEIISSFTGDSPEMYFFGVARRVYYESVRRSQKVQAAEINSHNENQFSIQQSAAGNCLNVCLEKLPPDEEELLLQYYENEKTAKRDLRQSLAAALEIDQKYLRVKIYRIKNALRDCISECIKKI